MSNITNLQEVRSRPRKGMGYEPPSGKPWLLDLKQGTRFLAKRRGDSGSLLTQFVVCTDPRAMPTVMLGESTDGMSGSFHWRDPDIFSQDWTFYYTLEVADMNNGNSNSILPGTMESHGYDPGSNH